VVVVPVLNTQVPVVAAAVELTGYGFRCHLWAPLTLSPVVLVAYPIVETVGILYSLLGQSLSLPVAALLVLVAYLQP
jgi:hypothetical protein